MNIACLGYTVELRDTLMNYMVLNGSLITLTYYNTIPSATTSSTNDFKIGVVDGYTDEWNGAISNAQIFNTTLPATGSNSQFFIGTSETNNKAPRGISLDKEVRASSLRGAFWPAAHASNHLAARPPRRWFSRVLMNAPAQGILPWYYNQVLPQGENAVLSLVKKLYAAGGGK